MEYTSGSKTAKKDPGQKAIFKSSKGQWIMICSNNFNYRWKWWKWDMINNSKWSISSIKIGCRRSFKCHTKIFHLSSARYTIIVLASNHYIQCLFKLYTRLLEFIIHKFKWISFRDNNMLTLLFLKTKVHSLINYRIFNKKIDN